MSLQKELVTKGTRAWGAASRLQKPEVMVAAREIQKKGGIEQGLQGQDLN